MLLTSNDTGKYVILGLSILFMIMFVPFSLFMALSFFNADPQSKSFSSRPNAYHDAIDVGAKFILACIYVIKGGDSQIGLELGIAALVCHLFIGLYLYAFLPYHNVKVNYTRFTMTGVLVWSGFWQIIVDAAGDPTMHETWFGVWVGLTPVFAAASYATIYYRHRRGVYFMFERLRKLPNSPALQEHGENSEEVYAFFVSAIKSARFTTPFNVELAARFISTHHTAEDVIMARAIYDHGLELFPESIDMQLLAGLFSGLYMSQFAQWKIMIKRSQEFEPSLIMQFFIFQQVAFFRASAEAKISGGKNQANDSLELRNLLRRSKKLHHAANTEALHFWKLLSSQKVDLNRVQHTVSKINHLEEVNVEIFEGLRQQNPKDPRVLLAFARFQDDVIKNYKKADLLYALADMHSGSAENDGADSNHSQSSSGSVDKDSDGRSQGSGQSGTSGAAARRRTGITRKEIKQYLEYRQLVLKLRPSAARRSVCVILSVVLLFISLAIAEAVWISQTVNQVADNIDTIRISGSRREVAVSVTDRLRTMEYLVVGGPDKTPIIASTSDGLDTYHSLGNQTLYELLDYYAVQQKLFFSYPENSPSYPLWLCTCCKLSIFCNV